MPGTPTDQTVGVESLRARVHLRRSAACTGAPLQSVADIAVIQGPLAVGSARGGVGGRTRFVVCRSSKSPRWSLRSGFAEFVNSYCRGILDTTMWKEIDADLGAYLGTAEGEAITQYAEGIPLGRVQTPDDVAAFVSYLASPDADYMTGQSPIIDGGLVMRRVTGGPTPAQPASVTTHDEPTGLCAVVSWKG